MGRNLLGDNPPASPMIGERNVRLDIPYLYAKPFSDLVYLLIKLTLCNRRTLIARPSTDSTTERATAKISFALFSRDFFDPSDGSHLPMDFAPIKREGCMWVCIHLVRFARIIVGVEDEATIVDLFEKYDPS